jgi:DNA repair protein RadC
MGNQIRETNEKAKVSGTASLSDAELLALVLKHSTYELDAVAYSHQLLSAAGGLRGLVDGVELLPEDKRLQLEAVREIGRRYLRAHIIGANFVRSPQAVSDYLLASLRDQKREVFKVLFLDKALRIMAEKDLFFGTIDEAAVHPREVVKEALLQNASSVVLVHNHPSGKVEPSREDYEITQKIKAACATVSVRVLDHIIIGENQYFSFSERNSL